jgi:hypothetical protein
MQNALISLKNNQDIATLNFEELKSAVGFPKYYQQEQQYADYLETIKKTQ